MIDIYFYEYESKAFYIEQERVVEIFIKSRVVVDVFYFREENPNYTRPTIKESNKRWFVIDLNEEGLSLAKSSKSNRMEPSEVEGDDLLICSPTVPGFSLGDKR
jgi:hypothetical protein